MRPQHPAKLGHLFPVRVHPVPCKTLVGCCYCHGSLTLHAQISLSTPHAPFVVAGCPMPHQLAFRLHVSGLTTQRPLSGFRVWPLGFRLHHATFLSVPMVAPLWAPLTVALFTAEHFVAGFLGASLGNHVALRFEGVAIRQYFSGVIKVAPVCARSGGEIRDQCHLSGLRVSPLSTVCPQHGLSF